MCGRTMMRSTFEEVATRFNIPPERWSGEPSTHQPSHNIHPGKRTPVIFAKTHSQKEDDLEVMNMVWGLVPSYTKKSANLKYHNHWKMFNARSETMAGSPIFKRLLAQHRRCVVPINGFYEWKKREGGKREPYFVFSEEEDFLFCAGLYDCWKDPETEEELFSYAILTKTPVEEIKWLHDRMPVILSVKGGKDWLRRGEVSQGESSTNLSWFPVTPKVGNLAYDEPDCCVDLREKVQSEHAGSIKDLFLQDKSEVTIGLKLQQPSERGRSLKAKSPLKKPKTSKTQKGQSSITSFFK
ncbi:SOS response-associated peptidase [Chloropicon primus]|uniref:SOS response-associated peptidase n=2 Tax=Chloropicon primus TaxID=1764295 RepID=A0A5B8MT52_9CHLO|nr:SOS response-associated peptidase [Chloropicon primus]UPR01783.1 SOS response-associated peptidase [Chloropicon primus]|eukprot:QDZ22562.1 SOS response-associated peptidase [Chloropicon primus]